MSRPAGNDSVNSGDGAAAGSGRGGSSGNGVGAGGNGNGRPLPPVCIDVEYPNVGFDDLLTQDIDLDPHIAPPRTWEELCKRCNVSLADLYAQHRVSARVTGSIPWNNPDMMYLRTHAGGRTRLQVTVSAQGAVHAVITQSSGDSIVDRTAVASVMIAVWLPTLVDTNPVDDTFEVTVTVDHVPRPTDVVLKAQR